MKKSVSLILAALLALCAVPLMASGGSESTSGADTVYTISYFAPNGHLIEDDSLVETILEEKLNIEIEVSHVDWQSAEQYNLMFASGEMPDAGMFGKDNQFMHYDEELARTIPLDLIKQYAPSFVKIYNENPLFWAYVITKEDENMAYGLPAVSETFPQSYLWTDFYRYDWILDLGIDIGVDVEKITEQFYVAKGAVPMDNFEKILEGYKSMGDDIIPFVFNGGIPHEQLSPFGLIMEIVNNNGEADQYFATEAYREALEWMARLYAKGLVDQEFPTQDRTVWWDKVNTGKAGYFPQSSNALNSWAIGRPPLSIWEVNPDAKILLTPGVGDSAGNYVSRDYIAPICNGQTFFVNADVTDEGKLIKILELFEYSNFPGDTETLATFVFGKQDVDWEWSTDKENWPVPIGAKDPHTNGAMTFCSQMQVTDYWQWLTIQPLYEAGGKYYVKYLGGIYNDHQVMPYTYDLFNETNLTEVKKDYWDTVNTVHSQFRNSVIMGDIKMTNATWEKYLADLNAAGYQHLRAEYNAAPVVSDLIEKYK
jgi:putative aldouronate transport system substrate-binding protein